MQLHRLAAIFLVVGILAGPCLAQPPLALVGTVEFVCAPENAANLPATCPGLPSSHPAKYGGSLPENPLPAPRGFETFSMIEAHEDERGDGYYIFGEERGSGHAPYLAFSTKAQINNSENWEIFVGRGISGSVAWVSQDVWQNQQNAAGQWKPRDRTKVFAPANLCGGFQVEWNEPLGRYLIFYHCATSAMVRVSRQAWGPWSEATVLTTHGEAGNASLLPNFDAQGPAQAGSRTTKIYWKERANIYSAALRQEGEN